MGLEIKLRSLYMLGSALLLSYTQVLILVDVGCCVDFKGIVYAG